MPTFRTTLLKTGGNNVGIEVPEEIVRGFGAGRRVPVTVTIRDHTYSSTIAVMGGKYLVGLNAAHREAAGVAGGEEHLVRIEHDSAARTVEVSPDLAEALAESGLRADFDGLAPSRRKEHVRAVEEAKKPETRQRRVAKVVDQLRP